MKYILITKGKDRTAIPLSNVSEIARNNPRQEKEIFVYYNENSKLVFAHAGIDRFEIREMSDEELTAWLKGEQEESKDDEEEEKSPLEDTIEKMVKAFKEANWSFKEPAKKIIEDIEPSDEDLEWQQYKQALETIYRGAPIGSLVPRHVRDWLEHELNIISAGT